MGNDVLLPDASPVQKDLLISRSRYRKLLLSVVVTASVVAILPLLVMTVVNYHQYQEAFRGELVRPVAGYTTNGQQSLESFISARLAALSLVIREKSIEHLRDQRNLRGLLVHMKQTFGGFVDLGVIDDEGRQVSYAGPYHLEGKSYQDHDWFQEVSLRGTHVSEVFMGHRHIPHFVIAARYDAAGDTGYVVRATIDTDIINRLVRSLADQPSRDAFIMNHEGVLQTPSRFYGDVLNTVPIGPLPRSTQTELIDMEDHKGEPMIVGYAHVEDSPFIMVVVSRSRASQASWLSLRRELVVFLATSIILILAVVTWGTTRMVNRIREADHKRAALFHKMEYTNKMAALGRLAAGVAHEINNPLSIINEKAGLMGDLLRLREELPPREKLRELVDSVLNSVDRCGKITHRLLGFAKHMDVQREKINLDMLLKEVLGFLEKEARYRSIQVNFHHQEDPPTIESDRGQLQQVFLNIINNAFAAVDQGGVIDITIERSGEDAVAVSIADNGMGVPEELLPHIFDPFFTTKKGAGTGLGLSITYGIVQKLGAQIDVKSKVGEGTCFTITLPISAVST